jgi:flagellar biogenesis protein FliO
MNLLANAVFSADESGHLTAVASAQADMPPLPQGDYGSALIKMFLAMIALVALLYLSYWFIKKLIQNRLQKGVGEQSIQVLEKRMISAKTMLYLVEVDQKKILLAESQLEIKRLASFDEAEPSE